MVYRRTVFDTRKRPKGLLRPKTRSNLKDAQSVRLTELAKECQDENLGWWHLKNDDDEKKKK